jgi:hypothetical protein
MPHPMVANDRAVPSDTEKQIENKVLTLSQARAYRIGTLTFPHERDLFVKSVMAHAYLFERKLYTALAHDGALPKLAQFARPGVYSQCQSAGQGLDACLSTCCPYRRP